MSQLQSNLERLKTVRDQYNVPQERERAASNWSHEELCKDPVMKQKIQDISLQPAVSQGYSVITQAVNALENDGVVSGHDLYANLTKAQVLLNGFDFKQNKENFMKMAEYLLTSGSEKSEKRKKQMKSRIEAVFELVAPLVKAQEEYQIALSGSLADYLEDCAKRGQLSEKRFGQIATGKRK